MPVLVPVAADEVVAGSEVGVDSRFCRSNRGEVPRFSSRVKALEYACREVWRVRTQWSDAICSHKRDPGEDMGSIERSLKKNARELQRTELQRLLQERANATPGACPVCAGKLSKVSERSITLLSSFGPVSITRLYGWCARCRKWVAPADVALGIDKEVNSPEMSENLLLLGTLVPPGQVEALSERLFGFRVDDNRVGRELERGAEKELEQRRGQDERALSIQGRHEVTEEIEDFPPSGSRVMVIEVDAWMIRERDNWGETERIRSQGSIPERWHEVKTATIFLTEARAEASKDRPVIVRRSFLATREKPFEFGQMLYAEAVRCGSLLADEIWFLADGGVWIWKLRQERFPGANGLLDRWHGAHHLHALSEAKFGKDSPEARQWKESVLHQLREGGEAGVIASLEDLVAVVRELPATELTPDQTTVIRECNYFLEHRQHLAYQTAAAKGVPAGTGAIESTCKQYQVRFKRCGQFWLRSRDEGYLALYSKWLSGKWPPLK